jgi:hypothetical protein
MLEAGSDSSRSFYKAFLTFNCIQLATKAVVVQNSQIWDAKISWLAEIKVYLTTGRC